MTLVSTPPTATPVPDGEALFKEARGRRRRRRILWAFLVFVVAVAVAALTATLGLGLPAAKTSQDAHNPRKPFALGPPAEIVAWTSAFKVVVLSTRTGHVVRTLASNVSIFAPGIPNVSVAPDGIVFFESATPSPQDTNATEGDRIFSVPVNGGPVRNIGSGSDPQVSPNGKLLAFIASEPAGVAGEAPYLVPPVGIDIATLSSGSVETVRTLEPGPVQRNQGASDLSWSSNSLRLSFNLLNPNANVTTAWTLAATTSTSLAQATQIPLHTAGLTWNGYWGDAKDGTSIGLGVLHSGSGGLEVVSINPSTGRVVGRLFRIHGEIFPDFSNNVRGDSSGANVLVAGVTSLVDGTPTTSGAVTLYRWQVGDRAPTEVANQIDVAAWGPMG